MFGIYDENYKVDFIKDLKLLKAKLENYKANICSNEDNDGNKNSIQNQVITNIYNNIEVSINSSIEQINQFPEDILTQEEKEFIEENKHFQLIIRLHTIEDNNDYKNSIITFLKVNKKKYNQYLRNKEIVWRKIDKSE